MTSESKHPAPPPPPSEARRVRAADAVTGAWHRTSRGWARSFRAEGCRVVVFQLQPDAPFVARVGPSSDQRQVTLGTCDRAEAERLVLEYLQLEQERVTAPPADDALFGARVVAKPLPQARPVGLTLHELACYYVGSERFQLMCNAKTQQNVHSALPILLAGLSPTLEVDLLDRESIMAYIRLRRAGGIAYTSFQQLRDGSVRANARTTGPVKARSIEHELTLLQSMINWACETRCKNRTDYLLHAPPMRESVLRGFKNTETEPRAALPREAIHGLLASALRLGAAAKAEGAPDVMRWYRLALALLIVDVTGERIGAIRQLRRADLMFRQRGLARELEVRFRADTTKGKRPRAVHFPAKESELAHQILTEIAVIGKGYIFPGLNAQNPATTDHLIDELKTLAEKAAIDLPDNSKWHGARARWATDRRHLDHRATMKAGGWSDYETFARYIRLTEDDMRAVVAAPRVDLTLPAFDGTIPPARNASPGAASPTARLHVER